MASIKIRINERDTFGIEVPTEKELTLDQFFGFVEILNQMSKKFNRGYTRVKDKQDFVVPVQSQQVSINEIENELQLYEETGFFSKALMIKLLKAYWDKDIKESERRLNAITKEYDLPILTREDIRIMIFRAINRWKIVPEDIGLRRFPTPGDDNINDLVI